LSSACQHVSARLRTGSEKESIRLPCTASSAPFESAHRRFLASVQALAHVRKLQANTLRIRVNARINLR
jgi:hypothetical protein